MAQLEIAQAGFIRPVIDGLMDAGANTDRLLISSGLNKFDLNDPEHYVPVHCIHSFFDELKYREGIIDLSDQFSEYIELASLSQWGEMIAYTPDLLTAIELAMKNQGAVLSHEKIGLEINGSKAKYWQCFSDRDSNGREQVDFLSFALATKAYYLAAGNDCAPLEIHFQSKVAPNLDKLLPPGNNTKILLGQAATAIVFPTSILTQSMLVEDSSYDPITEFPTFTTYSSKIESLLCSMRGELTPNIDLFTEVTELSARTLQRKLAGEGTTLSEVVGEWRFKLAIQLLENPETKVKDIHEQLGYANAPNFVRAFRRWTGVSPNRYREQL